MTFVVTRNLTAARRSPESWCDHHCEWYTDASGLDGAWFVTR